MPNKKWLFHRCSANNLIQSYKEGGRLSYRLRFSVKPRKCIPK